jgi:hypothetical protein
MNICARKSKSSRWVLKELCCFLVFCSVLCRGNDMTRRIKCVRQGILTSLLQVGGIPIRRASNITYIIASSSTLPRSILPTIWTANPSGLSTNYVVFNIIAGEYFLFHCDATTQPQDSSLGRGQLQPYHPKPYAGEIGTLNGYVDARGFDSPCAILFDWDICILGSKPPSFCRTCCKLYKVAIPSRAPLFYMRIPRESTSPTRTRQFPLIRKFIVLNI